MSTATKLAVDWTEQELVPDAITHLDAADGARRHRLRAVD